MPTACNLIHVPGAAHKPDGDLILVDIAREEASVIVSDLKELGIPQSGSIAIESSETHISDRVDEIERRAPGDPGDAVVWEEVEARTSEDSSLTASFVLFMILASVIATIGILQDSEILIVGAMVVGPEFGPIAGFSVAIVEKRVKLAGQSLLALAVGLPAAMLAAWLLMVVLKAAGHRARDVQRGRPRARGPHLRPRRAVGRSWPPRRAPPASSASRPRSPAR